MTPARAALIRESWAAVEPIADDAARLFYGRLFEVDPGIAQLFHHADMDKQRMVLMQTLSVVVDNVDRLDRLMPEVEALGRRHAGYGAAPEYFPIVGSALLWTLEQGLGDAFTDETAHAWADAYRRLSSSMIEAARQAQARAALPRRRRWRGPAPLPLGLATGSVST
jgi:hemoglobin-like flavoprotein